MPPDFTVFKGFTSDLTGVFEGILETALINDLPVGLDAVFALTAGLLMDADFAFTACLL